MKYLLYLIEAILAVNMLIVIHELGHMLAGRLFRIPSLKFCIGLGPRLVGIKYKGTDFCLAMIPLGGFVMLARGHNHDSQTACMDCISIWKRMLILFSGPAANLLFVVFLFWAIYFGIGFRDSEPVIAVVEAESTAATVGFQPQDKILQVNGRKVISWSQVELVYKKSQEKAVTAIVSRHDKADPAGSSADNSPVNIISLSLPPQQGLEGLRPVEQTLRFRLGPGEAIQKAVEKVWFLLGLLYRSLAGLLTGTIPASDLTGPVFLYHFASQTAASSQVSFLFLLAFISASFFFFNMLPLPVLDGGQILLASIQGLRKKPIGARPLMYINYVSFASLILLLVSATYNDVVRLLN